MRASLCEIIKDAWAVELIQFPPPKKRKFPPTDWSKYYKFHKDYGHNANDYITLKDEIKYLTRKGRLSRYRWYDEQKEWEEHDRRTRSWLPRQRDNNQMNVEENQILGTVEAIMGGFTGGGSLHNAWKWHLWIVITAEAKQRKDQYEPIYFTEDDIGDIDWAHDNLMVISALVHNFLVKQILANQGSSIDILYSHMAEALNLEKCMYNTYAGALVGFTRE